MTAITPTAPSSDEALQSGIDHEYKRVDRLAVAGFSAPTLDAEQGCSAPTTFVNP
jgi:hypothetical protein